MTESAPQPPEDQQSPLQNGDATALRTLCAQLHEKVNSFLNEDVKTERLRATQAQTRRSLAVIQEALDRYEFASPELSDFYLFRPLTCLTFQTLIPLPLLQRRQRLSRPPDPLSLRPVHAPPAPRPPPVNLHPPLAPFPSRRRLRRLFLLSL